MPYGSQWHGDLSEWNLRAPLQLKLAQLQWHMRQQQRPCDLRPDGMHECLRKTRGR
jgi:hypothetical protein